MLHFILLGLRITVGSKSCPQSPRERLTSNAAELGTRGMVHSKLTTSLLLRVFFRASAALRILAVKQRDVIFDPDTESDADLEDFSLLVFATLLGFESL